jgi:hypothetical protein
MPNLFSRVCLVVFALQLWFAGASFSSQRTIQVRLAGYNDDIELRVPNEFRRPSTRAEIEFRDEVLATLYSNSARRARYSEILSIDWNTPSLLPRMNIVSLGTLISHQGRIKRALWEELKEGWQAISDGTTSNAVRDAIEARQRTLSEGSIIDIEIVHQEILPVFTSDRNSATIVSEFLINVSGSRSIDAWASMKLIYTPKVCDRRLYICRKSYS